MRIRKHSILSSPPFRPTSLSSNSPTIDVCEFNRSPWDTIPLNTLQSEYPFQVNEKEEYPSYSVGKEPVNNKRNIVCEEEEYDEFREEERKPCVKKRGRNKSKEEKREPGYIQCSKTNGGEWQCKEEAKQGKRLCERHRMQKEFCKYKYDRSIWKSTEDKPSKTVMARKKKNKRASEFHYYTMFGPSLPWEEREKDEMRRR